MANRTTDGGAELARTLEALAQNDAAMKRLALGDLEALEESVGRRARLVQAAAEQIAEVRLSNPSDTVRKLEASLDAGMHTMRQIILAKHLLASELGQLKRERLLLEALREDPAPSIGLEVRG